MANKSFQGLFSPLEVVSTNNLLKIQQDQCKIVMSRLYFSNVFKIYYISLIVLLITVISLLLIHIPTTSKLIFLLEIIITCCLFVETLFKGFMQGWLNYFKQFWNILDSLVTVGSIILLWIGADISQGIGAIDDISASLAIIIRCGIQLFRLIMVIKRKGEQDVQIIDLNGISEGDEAPQNTEKNFRPQKKTTNNLTSNKKNFEDSVDESRQI
jgi:hypothetical protein